MIRFAAITVVAFALSIAGCDDGENMNGSGGGNVPGTGNTPGTGNVPGGGPPASTSCVFQGDVHGAGWGGPPSCSTSTIEVGDTVTCTANFTGAVDAFVSIQEPESFDRAGEVFVEIDGDGEVEFEIQVTQVDPTLEYVLDLSVTPSSNEEGLLFLVADSTDNYFYREYRGPGLDSTANQELQNCPLLTFSAP